MTVCSTCKHANYCEIVAGGYSSQVKSCRDYRKGEMTNEEWLRQASTEDVAKWLSKISKFFHECGKRDVYPKTMYEEDWEWWLKEIHE